MREAKARTAAAREAQGRESAALTPSASNLVDLGSARERYQRRIERRLTELELEIAQLEGRSRTEGDEAQRLTEGVLANLRAKRARFARSLRALELATPDGKNRVTLSSTSNADARARGTEPAAPGSTRPSVPAESNQYDYE